MTIPKKFTTEGPWKHPGGKLLRDGPQTLSDAELLAIIISSGTPQKSAMQIATELMEKFQSFRGMADQIYVESEGEKSIEAIIRKLKSFLNKAILTNFPKIKKGLDKGGNLWDKAYFSETLG